MPSLSKAAETSVKREALFGTINALEQAIPALPEEVCQLIETLRPQALQTLKATWEMGVDDGKRLNEGKSNP